MKTFKPLINDYDAMNRVIQNKNNQEKHRESIVKMIELFKNKHLDKCESVEQLMFVNDLCRRLNQKLNGGH